MNVGWLLLKKSITTSWRRMALIAGAIAVGISMLLAFTAAYNALMAKGNYSAWQHSIYEQQHRAAAGESIVMQGVDPLYVSLYTNGNLNKWQNQTIWTTSVYVSGPNAPKLDGITFPAAGEYYASPALAKLIQDNPQDQIGQRFGDKLVGTIPDKYLSSPDSLMVIRGISASEANIAHIQPIYSLNIAKDQDVLGRLSTSVLYLGIFILLFPIMLLVSIAARLGSVQREQRYAALRLIGATKSQVERISALESLSAAITGAIIGSLIYFATRPLLYQFRFGGERFWPADIAISPLQYFAIISIALILTLAANWWGLRQVRSSPLGVVQRQRQLRKPRWWRMLPLLAGFGLIAYIRLSTVKDQATGSVVYWFLLGIILIMVGLVVIGPWLTRLSANLIAIKTKRPITLLGTKHIAVHSAKVFRSVSGVVVALFAASFYLSTVGGIQDMSTKAISDNGYSRLQTGVNLISSDQFSNDFSAKLAAQPYISKVVPVEHLAQTYSVIACSDAPSAINITCPNDDNFVAVNFDAPVSSQLTYGQTIEALARQLTANTDPAPASTKQYLVYMADDNLDRLRSFVAIETAPIISSNSYVVNGTQAHQPVINPTISDMAGLAYAGTIATMAIAIVSLAISTTGGLLERRRSLATLYLGGVQISQLKAMVAVESLIPLCIVTVTAACAGVGIGYIFMQMVASTLDAQLPPFFIAVLVGLLIISTITIYLIMPIINKLVSTDNNRSE